MKIGDKIFWRWRSPKRGYDEGIVTGINGNEVNIKRAWGESEVSVELNEIEIMATQ